MPPTPHNAAQKDQIAKTVLMPGDPQRARFIAETFLDSAALVSDIRDICAYTGTYGGKPVTVMASGMGMPSLGIYTYELYKFYDVDRIIRIGTTGSYLPELALYDTVLATSAWSDSSFARVQSGDPDDIQLPSAELNDEPIPTTTSRARWSVAAAAWRWRASPSSTTPSTWASRPPASSRCPTASSTMPRPRPRSAARPSRT